MKTLDLTCSKCGATMKAETTKGIATCQYCGHQMIFEFGDKKETIIYREREVLVEKTHSPKRVGTAVFLGVVAVIMMFAAMGHVSKPKINPFDYISVSFHGIDGDGELTMDVINVSTQVDANRIRFDASKDDYLLQGESITITAKSDDYRLEEEVKVYMVEGLDEYVKDVKDIPDSALPLIHAKAESSLSINIDNAVGTGEFKGMKPVKMYLLSDGKQENELYDVYEAQFAGDGWEKTLYLMVGFSDVIAGNGGNGDLQISGGMYWGHITQVRGWVHVMAYASVEEIYSELMTSKESSMTLTERDLEK